ncbi:capsular polysaccharide export protein, LipB/KpsS family [Pseudogemmobacter faecipullorum]|uniref:Capsule polysaccharide biosynthesis protein n=1 Tax=Pseudogemmobacter faecipullorum TaxID=2755041 RepID=A0ABS8CRF7_9RHOB|nr:hypothetical protein [Pseudogemmobacter faecipullorum]MCB5411981.1 hypothetical protein [Pseudogemmobacter faecipullorum]
MIKPTTVLLYVRPWNVSQMEHLARGVWGGDVNLALASEHRSVDRCNLAKRFNSAYLSSKPNAKLLHLTESEALDVTLRCRLLRNIDPRLARRLLVAMEQSIEAVLDETDPKVMLSLTVDSYVMDLFAILCGRRGIRFIGLVPTFIKEHFRISTRGEYVESRNVTDAEIDEAMATLIVTDYRPDFLVQSTLEMRKQMWRLWWRNLPKPLWFALRRMKPGNKLNYHYWVSQNIALQYWSLWPQRLDGISGPDLVEIAHDGGADLIYLPLQMSPEATIDYWSSDTRWIDYENFILDLLRQYRGRWRFMVKEHPNLLGYRSRGFYSRLKAEPNCIMVSPKVSSNELVSVCRGVLVCTGTAGFEAALRGKPVLSDSKPYYASAGDLLPVNALDSDFSSGIEGTTDQRRLMAHLLRGILPGRFLNNGTWSADNAQHRLWNDTMVASIRHYLKCVDDLSLGNEAIEVHPSQ